MVQKGFVSESTPWALPQRGRGQPLVISDTWAHSSSVEDPEVQGLMGHPQKGKPGL